MSYIVRIKAESQPTLDWLAARGYDGDFMRLADLETGPEDGADGYIYRLSEPAAWEFQRAIEADPVAFLTCCGDTALAEALISLHERIV